MIYKHDYQRMALDTDRMMITHCDNDYHDYSNNKLACIYIKWAEEHCPERLQAETVMAESMFILTSVSLSVKKKSGKSGIKCVLLILNMHLR